MIFYCPAPAHLFSRDRSGRCDLAMYHCLLRAAAIGGVVKRGSCAARSWRRSSRRLRRLPACCAVLPHAEKKSLTYPRFRKAQEPERRLIPAASTICRYDLTDKLASVSSAGNLWCSQCSCRQHNRDRESLASAHLNLMPLPQHRRRAKALRLWAFS
jgi:hypothetical protein